MKQKFIYLTLFILSCHLQSCGQTPKNELQMKEMMTTQQMIDSMKVLVQKHDFEPQYIMKINANSSYIIKVNDIYETAYFWDPRSQITSYITSEILKSGKQTLDIEIHPTVIVKDDQGKQYDALIPEQSFNVVVEQSSWNPDAVGPKSGPTTKLLEFDLKKYVEENNIQLTDEKVIKVKLTFDANVPFNFADNIQWKDLRKMDRKELEQRVRKFYKAYAELYEQRDDVAINNTVFNQSIRVMTSLYYTPTMIEQGFNADRKKFEKYEDIQVIPIDETNTEMQFFNHGKQVMLVNNSKDDLYNFGEGGFMLKIDEGYALSTEYIYLLLGIPEGEDEFVVF